MRLGRCAGRGTCQRREHRAAQGADLRRVSWAARPVGDARCPKPGGSARPYTAAQLRAYRSGARKHEVMAVMAKPLTDDDIAHLAAWFASIRVDAQPPR